MFIEIEFEGIEIELLSNIITLLIKYSESAWPLQLYRNSLKRENHKNKNKTCKNKNKSFGLKNVKKQGNKEFGFLLFTFSII